eukprot:scaffold12610_cov70-Skeletonema_dohrnii-CCMP3373.AAC.2
MRSVEVGIGRAEQSEQQVTNVSGWLGRHHILESRPRYRPTERGGVRSCHRHGRVQPLSTSASGWSWSHTPDGFLRSPNGYDGRPEEMRRTMLHLTTGQWSSGSFHGLLLPLVISIWMFPWKVGGDKYNWGIKWQLVYQWIRDITRRRRVVMESPALLPPSRVKDGFGCPEEESWSTYIVVSDYGDICGSNVGSHRTGRRACKTAIHTSTARADGMSWEHSADEDTCKRMYDQ